MIFPLITPFIRDFPWLFSAACAAIEDIDFTTWTDKNLMVTHWGCKPGPWGP
jgi:hypothetical protein